MLSAADEYGLMIDAVYGCRARVDDNNTIMYVDNPAIHCTGKEADGQAALAALLNTRDVRPRTLARSALSTWKCKGLKCVCFCLCLMCVAWHSHK